MKKWLSVILAIAITATVLCSCKETPSTLSSDTPVYGSDISNKEPEEKPLSYKDSKGAFKAGDTLNGVNNLIKNLTYVTDNFKVNEKIELKADIDGLSADLNVYDEKDVDYSISLTSSSGKKITLPGFYYEGYNFDDGGRLTTRSDTAPDFRFRIALTEAASWDFVITLKIKGEEVDKASGYINVEKNEADKGCIQVEKTRKQNFVFADGTPYTAIGSNICYADNNSATSSSRGAQMIEWMKNSAAYGSNFTRIWLSNWFLGIQKGTAPNDFSKGMTDAAQLDRIFDAWHEMGMYGQVCLFSFNSFFDNPESAESAWKTSPYNSLVNGGYLEKPSEFFVNERAIEDTKAYFRYLVARYAYSTNIFAWELFNEVDLTTGYSDNFENVVEWNGTMVNYIRSIDPYGHMITTSTASRQDVVNSQRIFDFASIHWYNYNNIKEISEFQQEFWYVNRRPVMLGEVGIMSAQIDEDLITFHQQNWAGVMGGGCGTGATWYWEKLDEVSGYWDYLVVSEMADHIPWNSEDMFVVATDNIKPSDKTVQALGYRGKDFAYLWLYDSEFTQVTKSAKDITNLKFTLKLNDGKYHARWINTWTGISISQVEVEAKDGEVELVAPVWSKDVALAITVD